MAKQVSQEKLDKITTRGEKKRAKKEIRQTNRAKKLAARKGLTEQQARGVMANRKQRRLEKFETAMGIREGVTTEKYNPTAGSGKYIESFSEMANSKPNMDISLANARKKIQENKINTQQQTDSPVNMKVLPITKRTSCKY